MPLYPQSFIQRLRDEILISQIIGSRLSLKKKGREFEACCPFHQEKTPSFFVNDQKGFYHCFGCSAHGDALKFLMEYEHLSYPQAIEALAREAGIPLPEVTPEMKRKEEKRQSLQEIVALAAQWFQQQLSYNTGQEARDYLARRGVSEAVIQQFGIGYAPTDRGALKEFLLSKGAHEKQLIEAGLIIRPDDGETYDRFRNRVIFPITNQRGEVIAFGGRLLAKSDYAPKYLNSPETPLFHKGHVLYNWAQARQNLRDETENCLIAEGYMDVIALHMHGFSASVAPLGTALSSTHLQGLWRYMDAPILCLDGDNAGQRAMWRSAELALPLLQPGKTLRFLTLPKGQDPDDFLSAQGASEFRNLIQQAKPLSQVIYQTVTQRHGNESPEQRAAADAELEQLVGQIQHEGVQHHFRRYFKEQHYARRNFSPSRAKGRKQHLRDSTPLPNISGQQQAIVNAQKSMIRLLLLHPNLLDAETIMMELENLHLQDPALIELQHQLLHGEVDEEDAAHLREDKRITLPQTALVTNCSTSDLLAIWKQLSVGLHVCEIDHEISALQHEMTEENLQRLTALQQEKQRLMMLQYS